MKKIFSIILTTCVLALTGCSEEFFNINQSPNSAIEENIDSESDFTPCFTQNGIKISYQQRRIFTLDGLLVPLLR